MSDIREEKIRIELERLGNASGRDLERYDGESRKRRLEWFDANRDCFDFTGDDPLENAYRVLLRRFGIGPEEAPVVFRDGGKIVFHSANFCPTLEACRILKLDTRYVCRLYNEKSTDALVKRLHPRLKFVRNYEKLRPYCGYCEEMIVLEDGQE